MFPLQRIIAAQMRANGEMQAQSLAKDAAAKQMDSTGKMVVTMKANPAGGPPLITVKDAPADLLNQTQESDVEQTYSRPKIAVEDALRERGFQPDDPTKFADPSSVDSYWERVSARRKLGGGLITSALMAGVTGSRKDDELRKNRANQTAAENSTLYQQFVQPVTKEEQDLAQLDIAGANAITSQQNAKNSQLNADRAQRKEYFDRLNKVVADTDLSLIDPSEWRASVEEQFGGTIPEYAASQIARKGQQDIGRALDAFMNKDKDALGMFASPEEAERAFARPITAQQKDQLRANWKASRDVVKARETTQRREDARLASMVASQDRMTAAGQRQLRLDTETWIQKNRGDYETATKKYDDLADKTSQIQALAEEAKSADVKNVGAVHQAMIITAVGAYDGTAAREGEQATLRAAAPIIARLRVLARQPTEGPLIDDTTVDELVRIFGKLNSSVQPRRKKIDDYYARRAKSVGVPPEDVAPHIGRSASDPLGIR